MKFRVVLFGKTIVYFNQILTAMHTLGRLGLGSDKSKYNIVDVRNGRNESILHEKNVYMERYCWESIGEYVLRRLQDFDLRSPILMSFNTPLIMKQDGEVVKTITSEPIRNSLIRRLYMITCLDYEDIGGEYEPETAFPDFEVLEERTAEVNRYSKRHNKKMRFRGLAGDVRLTHISEEWLKILAAGEIIGIGKNTSFGCGQYSLKNQTQEGN